LQHQHHHHHHHRYLQCSAVQIETHLLNGGHELASWAYYFGSEANGVRKEVNREDVSRGTTVKENRQKKKRMEINIEERKMNNGK